MKQINNEQHTTNGNMIRYSETEEEKTKVKKKEIIKEMAKEIITKV